MQPSAHPNAARARSVRGGPFLLLLVLLGGLLPVWAGCGTPRERYKVLSFFFDGVPDPDAPPKLYDEEGNEIRTTLQRGGVAVGFFHKPYSENKCNACHDTAPSARFDDFTKAESKVCLKCHQDATHQYPVMHGPVAAVECLWCHLPHESSVAKLLRDKPPAVCVQCHERDFLPFQPPEHQDPERNCLDCHYGHGGPQRGLVRSITIQWPSTQPAPATQPATQPAMPPASTQPAVASAGLTVGTSRDRKGAVLSDPECGQDRSLKVAARSENPTRANGTVRGGSGSTAFAGVDTSEVAP